MDAALLIDQAMTASERATFLDAFLKLNPRWRGAHVADVIDTLGNSDSHLDMIEPVFEAHGSEITNAKLTASAAIACVYLYGPEGVTWERIQELVSRAEGR